MNVDVAKSWCEAVLHRLDASFRWAAGLVAVSLWATISRSPTIKLLDMELDRAIAGTAVFLVLLGVFVQVGRLFSTMSHILSSKGAAAAQIAEQIRLDPSLGNPFAESLPEPQAFVDSLGFVIVVIMWTGGGVAGIGLVGNAGGAVSLVAAILFGTYMAVAGWIAIRMIEIVDAVASNDRLKTTRLLAAIAALMLSAIPYYYASRL